jgi:hypothetical protein
VRDEIRQQATQNHWSLRAVADEFERWANLDIRDASADVLDAFLENLKVNGLPQEGE